MKKCANCFVCVKNSADCPINEEEDKRPVRIRGVSNSKAGDKKKKTPVNRQRQGRQ